MADLLDHEAPDDAPVRLTLVPDHAAAGEPVRRRRRSAPSSVRAARINAARTATRARRTWLAALFFPVFALFLAIDGIRSIAARLSADRASELERRPIFERPAGMPTGDRRSVADIAATVEAFPYEPRRMSTNTAFFRDNGSDAIGALLSPFPHAGAMHRYPATFRQRLFTGADGEQVAGMVAMHDHPGPAIIICHGLLMTKNFDLIIQVARRAFEQWGFHVVTLDLRGWGQTAWTSEAPSSAGFHEGRDVVEVARALRESHLVTSVGALGYSLGGSTVLNAARHSSVADDHPLDGGVIAVSAPTDLGVALDEISTKPRWRDPLFGLWQLFQATVRGTVRVQGLRPEIRTFRDLVHEVSLPFYGITYEQYARQASARDFAREIETPVLALHARDDFLIPVQHAYDLRDAAAENPNVHVIVHDEGAHVSLEAVEPRWFNSTVRRWFEYWATPGDYVATVPDINDGFAAAEANDAPID
ncbi:MAG: alpha/beta hydrolase fold protein [Thermoleophilia bacterium]|nr:alpha/beta hydrolase fold protein [Thermoleophilia bacterium]